MKKLCTLLFLLLTFLTAGWLCLTPTAANATVVITESPRAHPDPYDPYYLDFTLNTDAAGITDFMVANNIASNSFIESANPALAGWYGYILERSGPGEDGLSPWYIIDSGYDTSWIDKDAPSLAAYTRAFLWTAYDVAAGCPGGICNISGGPLGIGIYSTFVGEIYSFNVDSPFVVHFTDGSSEYGETTNAVPEPLTILLLGAGLVGISGLRSKFSY